MADADAHEPLVVAVLAAPGVTRELAGTLVESLPDDLARELPGAQWRAVVGEVDPADPAATSPELVDALRRRLLEEDWDLVVGLTDLPLRAGRRPVTAHASATHGVGLVSVPALGAVGVARRLRTAAVRLVEGLLGEPVGHGGEGAGRGARVHGRLRELAAPIGRAKVHDDGSVRFVGAALRGNLRLLVGMVRANQPTRVIVRLSSALVTALGTAAIALAASNVWQLADGLSWARLAVLALLSWLGTCLALILAHGLWERAWSPRARERVVLFNLATAATVALGVLAFYVALFALTALGGLLLIPDALFEQTVQHPVGVVDYLHLAVLVATLATVGGALGSLVDSDLAVRDAAYRSHADERTEAAAD
jgi:hypothetical protein